MSATFQRPPRKSKSGTPVLNGSISHDETPVNNGLPHMSQKVEQNITPHIGRPDASFRNEDKISPMLAKLRMTPGRLLKEKQSVLVRLHEETRKRADSLNVGGGVSLWPEMENMRMSAKDVYRLVGLCVILVLVVIAVFVYIHGWTLSQLMKFNQRLNQFPSQHKISVNQGQTELDNSLITWHTKYKDIVDSIHEEFDMSKLPTLHMAYMLVYLITLAVLFYYLIDNMFAKSKLSPRRIKRWVTLLVVTSTWTCLLGLTFLIALHTENAIEINIHHLSNTLAEVIPTDLSCDKFSIVLQYWRFRCLPPTTHGTISIFGVLPVRDVTSYLQYYSIPVLTVLLTPVFRLIVSLMTIYNVKHEKSS